MMQNTTEILNLVKTQEQKRIKIEDAVKRLERRLILIEEKKLKVEENLMRNLLHKATNVGVEGVSTGQEKHSSEADHTEHYSCIYVSPLFENMEGSAHQGLNTSKGISYVYSKDADIQEVEADTEKLDAEVLAFKVEMKELSSQESKHMQSNDVKFDKVTSDLVPYSMGNYHQNKLEKNINDIFIDSLMPFSEVGINLVEEGEVESCIPLVIREDIDRMEENKDLFSSTTEHDGKGISFNRSVRVPYLTEKRYPASEVVRASVIAIQRSMDNLCKNNNSFEDGDLEEFKGNEQSVIGELYILQKTICKLLLTCQKEGNALSVYKMGEDNQNFNENANLRAFRDFYVDILYEISRHIEDLQQELLFNFSMVNGKFRSIQNKQLLPDIEDSESLKISLDVSRRQFKKESVCNKLLKEKLENEVRTHDKSLAEYATELEMKEKILSHVHQLNYQLANEISKTEITQKELRSIYEGLVESLENQLKDAHIDLLNLQETADCLTRQLTNTEARVSYLEQSLEDKDKHLSMVKRRMQSVQLENDATIVEKFELVTRVQQMKKEAQEQKWHITKLCSINDALVHCAQAKDDQLASLCKEVMELQQAVQKRTEETFKIMEELVDVKKTAHDLNEQEAALELQYRLVKSKLTHTEYEVSKRTKVLEKMAEHLAANMDGIYHSHTFELFEL